MGTERTCQLTTLTSTLYDAALALVYPQACAVCGGSVESRHDGVACAACWKATRLFADDDTLCWKCGAFTRANVSEDRRKSIRCGQCDEDSFTAARACGFYEGALRASVLELKREPHVAARLAHLMLAAQQREPINSANLIIPVPLHPGRERERGFNQAALLARELVSPKQTAARRTQRRASRSYRTPSRRHGCARPARERRRRLRCSPR